MCGVGEGVVVSLERGVAVAVGVVVGVGVASVEHPTVIIVISTRVKTVLNRTRLGYRKKRRNAGDSPRDS